MSLNEKISLLTPASAIESYISAEAGLYSRKPKAIDLSHHLSDVSKARTLSPLKGLAKYFGLPGLISLAGGMPSPEYFPFASISADALVPDSYALSPNGSTSAQNLSWFWRLFSSKTEKTEFMSIPKYASGLPTDEVSLEVALQYGTAQGLVPLQRFMREFTAKVYQPQYADFTTLVHAGNTDGWQKCMQTLCNPGDMILTEEWTYPSALSSAHPYGVLPVPVKIDGEGMRADDLRNILAEWDDAVRGAKRPRVMYTVPIGQNPTGATMGPTRKREIYAVCVEFDVIIVEDDPYYFLQQDAYIPEAARKASSTAAKGDDKAFIHSLAPSFLRFDYQGRVIRLDTFSKTIAPGSRLGWFTCNPVFAERLERQSECSTQAPCGFSQSLVTQLLTTQWGFSGYIRWLRGLRNEYTMRRDGFIDAFAANFDLQQQYIAQGALAGCTALVASIKSPGRTTVDEKRDQKTLFSFVPPSAGMFIWLRINLANHPSAARGGLKPEDKAKLEIELHERIADAGVLCGPGWFFAATDDIQKEREGHFRISFSFASRDDTKKAVGIISQQIKEFFEEH